MEKKQFEIEPLSPDTDVIIGMTIALSKNLTGMATPMFFEIKQEKENDPTELEAPALFISGQYDLVRAKLHSLLDEVLDSHQDMAERKDPNLRRKNIKSIHQGDGKPMVWSPG